MKLKRPKITGLYSSLRASTSQVTPVRNVKGDDNDNDNITAEPARKKSRPNPKSWLDSKHKKYDASAWAERYTTMDQVPEHLKKCTTFISISAV
jgi:hypothetical protein